MPWRTQDGSLLVGINYDKNGPEGKKHTCKIEKVTINRGVLKCNA